MKPFRSNSSARLNGGLARHFILPEFGEGYKPQAGVFPARQPIFESLQRMFAVAAQDAVIAIVQEDDIAAPSPPQAVDHGFGRLRRPIAGHSRPHDDSLPAIFAHEAAEKGTAKTIRRAHPLGRRSRGGFDGFITTAQLFRNFLRRKKNERRMRVGVIADGVAAPGDLEGERLIFADEAADQKKRGASAVAFEQFQEPWGERGVGAVVEGQRERSGAGRTANRGAP